MTNKNYVAGANFERKVGDWYESFGCDPVIRSAGSHGDSDITAHFYGKVIFNSLRLNEKWSQAEIERLQEIARKNNGIARLVWRDEKGKIQFKDV